MAVKLKRVAMDAVKQVVRGCDHVLEEDGALVFRRLPAELGAHYAGPAGQVRVECPAGVRLEFVSQTRVIRLGLRYGKEARRLYQGAIRVDGGEAVSFGPESRTEPWMGNWSGTVFQAEEPRPRRFQIWLPHLVRADLTHLEIEADCPLEPLPVRRPRWLAYGDSITQGMTARWPTDTYVGRCAAQLEADVLNLGVGGGTMAGFLAEHPIAWGCDLITIAYGINDWSHAVTLEEIAGNTRALLSQLTRGHPGVPVLLLTPIPLMGRSEINSAGRSVQEFRAAITKAGSEFPTCRVVDGLTLVPADASLYVDGTHPNDQGMEAYAEALVREIRALIRPDR